MAINQISSAREVSTGGKEIPFIPALMVALAVIATLVEVAALVNQSRMAILYGEDALQKVHFTVGTSGVLMGLTAVVLRIALCHTLFSQETAQEEAQPLIAVELTPEKSKVGALIEAPAVTEENDSFTSSIIPPSAAPMPGLLKELLVQDGQLVEEGMSILVMEAMKMENTIRTERAGRIKFHALEGALIEQGQPLFTIEPL